MKKLSLVFGMCLFLFGSVGAQRTITGTVSNDTGKSLIGASVLVKGTAASTITDIDGIYRLNIPAGEQTLVVSYTDHATKEITTSTSNVLDVILSEGIELTGIVVTDLGIKREKKALEYRVSNIRNNILAGKQEADIARLVRGKATGVDLPQNSGMTGSGTNVIIRGYSSISGSNQPLFVIDGIPFNPDQESDGDIAIASSRFLDLDPNSIKVSILKGVAATVRYGEAGRNGVILVTTKTDQRGEILKKISGFWKSLFKRKKFRN